MSGILAPAPGTVAVRMYRTGLGDCFLLGFGAAEGGPRFVLIDFGIFNATSGGSKRMRDVAASIHEATGGRLHVLVATHEHYDHLSGFIFAREAFDGIDVDQVWLAWTEDPRDEVAQEILNGRRQALHGLEGAVQRLKMAASPAAERIESVLQFFGASGQGLTARALEYVQKKGPCRYCRPGEILEVEGVPDVRVYVLGPPRDRTHLMRANPSRVNSEVYEHGFAVTPESALMAAIEATDPEADEPTAQEREILELSYPFDEHHRIPLEAALEHDPFFREFYGAGPEAEDAWRRVDAAWLEAAGQLALALDNATNNTSLALAIELVGSGKVLLFPGDAQVGNWVSWDSVEWPDQPEVTTGDLLARTVLYKVGHHGSHNATMRELGLERMTHPELTAMIPVDQVFAERSPRGWHMPFGPLLERLQEKTRGRVLRADTGLPSELPGASEAEAAAFAEAAREDPLWVQYTIHDDGVVNRRSRRRRKKIPAGSFLIVPEPQ